MKLFRLRAAALAFVALLTLGACASEDDGGAIDAGDTTATSADDADIPDVTTGDMTGASGGNAVTIKGFAFGPSAVTVAKGTKVTWTNEDTATHTVTADSGGAFDKELEAGGTFEHTFDTAGTFAYHCERHPNMKGSVTVE